MHERPPTFLWRSSIPHAQCRFQATRYQARKLSGQANQPVGVSRIEDDESTPEDSGVRPV
jgi:hypothetical protein